jgi:uncharacterized damage-inducible protein DinB
MEYRKGAIGAMTDEYEKALNELKIVLETVSEEVFFTPIDSNDEDCKSIRNIIFHVVKAGYAYCNYIRKHFGNEFTNPEIKINSIEEAISELDTMFQYNVATFADKWHLTDNEISKNIIVTTWATYELEGIIEHSIVHILRHRLQIQKITNYYEI